MAHHLAPPSAPVVQAGEKFEKISANPPPPPKNRKGAKWLISWHLHIRRAQIETREEVSYHLAYDVAPPSVVIVQVFPP